MEYNIRVYKPELKQEEGKINNLKGFATITFDEAFCVKSLAIKESSKGNLYLDMPRYRDYETGEYVPFFRFTDKEFQKEVLDTVREAYENMTETKTDCKAHTKITEEVAKLEHSSDDAQFIQLQKYNSVIAGLHEYYCIATEVSQDFGRLAFAVNKQLRNRLKGDLSKKGQLRNGFIREKYGASKQLRFLHGRPIVPLGYVQPKNAQHKRKAVNKYTAEGRKQIHQNLKFNTSVMLWMMRNPVKNRTVEYADNRISLFAAQYGKCAITGMQLSTDDIHCHHKVPVSKGGGDEYANLILVSKDIHTIIHASTDETIRKYLTILKLDAKQLTKLNKLRTMAEMPQIIL